MGNIFSIRTITRFKGYANNNEVSRALNLIQERAKRCLGTTLVRALIVIERTGRNTVIFAQLTRI